jgi:hypothetical protein
MVEPFIKYILGEFRMIANAPVSYIVAVLGAALLIWIALGWRYDAIINNKDSEITLLKSQRDDYRDKLGGASPDQAKARIDDLERRIGPRYPLTADQEKKLGAALERVPSNERFEVVVFCPHNAALYANIMVKFFNDHGWKAKANPIFIITSTSSGVGVGLSNDVMTGMKTVSSSGAMLMKLFDSSAIEYGKAMFDQVQGDSYWFIVAQPPIN